MKKGLFPLGPHMLRMFWYLPEEDAAVAAEVQSVSVVLPLGVVLLEGEVEPLPVHAAAGRQTHVHRELWTRTHRQDRDIVSE